MNIKKSNSPQEDKYNKYIFNPKGNNNQILSIGKTNLFSQSFQPKSLLNNKNIYSPLFENNLIKENSNSYNFTNQNLNLISIAGLIQEEENLTQALKKEII